jgi:hypothetical protein
MHAPSFEKQIVFLKHSARVSCAAPILRHINYFVTGSRLGNIYRVRIWVIPKVGATSDVFFAIIPSGNNN